MQVIQVMESDDLISILDRLDWYEDKQVLLRLPENGRVLKEGLDLVRLRRHADGLRLEVGLVTTDPDLSDQAKALGFPTFINAEVAENNRLGWWRGKRRREQVGLPSIGGGWTIPPRQKRPRQLDLGDREEVHRRLTPDGLWRRWLWRYVAIVIFFMTIAALFVGFAYSVPSAIITLKPNVESLQVVRQIVADPNLTETSGSSVPGRVMTVVQTWQADVETTGIATIPSTPARGTASFVNLIESEVEVPVGTRVRTSDGSNLLFQTIEPLTLAGIVGATGEVEITAVFPGPQGNVEANLINEIEGSLAVMLEVRNLDALIGGAVRETQVVSEADQARLRLQVLQFIQAVVEAEMEADLTEREFLAVDSLRVVQVYDETYSHFLGEQTTRLKLEMRVEMQATAVDTSEASGLIFDALATQVPEGFSLVPESILFTDGDVLGVDEAGRITFEMYGEGVVAADLPLAASLEVIGGQSPEVAAPYLYQSLPLRDVPTVQIWPVWFERVPYLPARIQTQVVTDG